MDAQQTYTDFVDARDADDVHEAEAHAEALCRGIEAGEAPPAWDEDEAYDFFDYAVFHAVPRARAAAAAAGVEVGR